MTELARSCGRTGAGLLGLVAAVALLAACTSSTSGSGHATGPSTSPAASRSADFPSQSSGPASSSSSVPASSSSSTGSGGGLHPVPAQPVRTVTVTATGGTTYVVKLWADVSDPSCFDHAYGQPVITFLTEHPCKG
ncbi:MAG: hypothetical protein J0H43_04800, partial [Actinobacteria bacterium]|nr:hypothetical protein [Actinomycetota bacterium]